MSEHVIPSGSTGPGLPDPSGERCCRPRSRASAAKVLAARLRAGLAALRRADRAWLAVVAILALLFVFDFGQALDSAAFVGGAALTVLPFLALSALTAAWVLAAGADALIGRAFRGHPARMIALAAATGALSPFCSCGVIPIVAALLAIGVPLAPVMAFWLASPLMDPAMFLMTTGTLGIGFALAKVAAAVGVGLLGGVGAHLLTRAGLLGDALRPQLLAGARSERFRDPAQVVWRFWSDPQRLAVFRRQAASKTWFLGKWLLLAFLLESLMLAWVPAEAVAGLVGGDGAATVALAAIVGAPAYLNGYAALPLVGGLMQQGMSAGAAMAFLVGGGVTSIPAMIAVWATARPTVFAVYIAFALTGAIAAGLLAGMIFGAPG
jgi:uncharacterized membrane protein YraQ (UPF0718 family)